MRHQRGQSARSCCTSAASLRSWRAASRMSAATRTPAAVRDDSSRLFASTSMYCLRSCVMCSMAVLLTTSWRTQQGERHVEARLLEPADDGRRLTRPQVWPDGVPVDGDAHLVVVPVVHAQLRAECVPHAAECPHVASPVLASAR